MRSFCYLGFEVVPSGVVTRAMNTLADKAKKALHPLLGAIAKFDLPGGLAIRLFHTYISPILLYGVENWSVLSGLGMLEVARRAEAYGRQPKLGPARCRPLE